MIQEPTNTFDMYRRSFKGSQHYYFKNAPKTTLNKAMQSFQTQARARTPANNSRRRQNISTKSREAAGSNMMMFAIGSKFPLRETATNRLTVSNRKRASVGMTGVQYPPKHSKAVQQSGSAGPSEDALSMIKTQNNHSATQKRDSMGEIQS